MAGNQEYDGKVVMVNTCLLNRRSQIGIHCQVLYSEKEIGKKKIRKTKTKEVYSFAGGPTVATITLTFSHPAN